MQVLEFTKNISVIELNLIRSCWNVVWLKYLLLGVDIFFNENKNAKKFFLQASPSYHLIMTMPFCNICKIHSIDKSSRDLVNHRQEKYFNWERNAPQKSVFYELDGCITRDIQK